MILLMVIATIGFLFGIFSASLTERQFRRDLATVLGDVVSEMGIDKKRFAETFMRKAMEFKTKK